VHLRFRGEIVFWRGPAPWHFVRLPDEEGELLAANVAALSYGWGCIPVAATLDGVRYTTSLFPKEGGYLLPVKADVRRRAGVELGDVVDVEMEVGA
jgi:hypothetical protein